MLITKHKLFWVWQFEKEEQWLNRMSAQGLQLADVGFCRYAFEQGLPAEYDIRLEMLDMRGTTFAARQYIEFIESTGAECVGQMARWVYFRKKSGQGGFDLFSDIDSRIGHLNRILALIAVLGFFNIINLINMAMRFFEYNDMQWLLPVLLLVLAIVLMLIGGFFKLNRMKQRLKQERALRE